MSKPNQPGRGPSMERSTVSPATLRAATLVGVVALLFVNLYGYHETQKGQEALNQRLDQIETRMTEMSSKLAAPRPTQARQGPDPNRVYPVKTDRAPFKGPLGAPVTVVEFSDFQ